MSRREGRESETKRLHSKPEREPSPKRPRRDGKPATERTSSDRNLDIIDHKDRDQKHRRRLQDALPLEAPLAPESKVGADIADKDFDRKTNEFNDGTKRSSDPTEVPRSRSYFQHDERGSAGQGGRSFSRRGTTERRWWRDPKEQSGDRESDKGGSNDMRQKDEKTQSKGEDKSVWHHDGFFQLEAEAPPQAKKRPAFREKKMPPDSGAEGIKPAESVRPSRPDRPVSGSENREERGGRHFRDMDRDERPLTGDRAQPYRSEVQRSGIPPRERFSGGSGFRGRDRYSGRHGEQKQYRHNTYRVEKWKHDLFDEANRSPTPKNEEDQIAKVEALLAL